MILKEASGRENEKALLPTSRLEVYLGTVPRHHALSGVANLGRVACWD